MSRLTREKARGCPVHSALFDRALDLLEDNGYFSKDEVTDACHFEAIADSIRWDYIKERIEETHGVNLLPVCSRFFRTHVEGKDGGRIRTADERKVSPGKYLAGGHGKKTAGYCNVTLDDGKLAIKKLMNAQGLRNGVSKAFKTYLEEYQKRGVVLPAPMQEHLPDNAA